MPGKEIFTGARWSNRGLGALPPPQTREVPVSGSGNGNLPGAVLGDIPVVVGDPDDARGSGLIPGGIGGGVGHHVIGPLLGGRPRGPEVEAEIGGSYPGAADIARELAVPIRGEAVSLNR